MQRIILLLSMALLPLSFVNAQFAKNNALFLSSELTYGNYFGGGADLNYVLKDKYSFKLGFSGGIRRAKRQPEDFTGALVSVFNPRDELVNLGLSAGSIFKLDQKGTIRINLLLGVGYAFITEPINWEKKKDSFLPIGANYFFDYQKRNTVSITINPKIEFPIKRFFGLTVSPILQINKDSIFYGLGIGYMAGLLR